MPHVGPILIDRRTLIIWIRIHENVLRDGLPRPFGHAPYFMILADEGAIFCYGAAFGDEPGHVEDFELAVVVVAGMSG